LKKYSQSLQRNSAKSKFYSANLNKDKVAGEENGSTAHFVHRSFSEGVTAQWHNGTIAHCCNGKKR
jgi:hypothetical protein